MVLIFTCRNGHNRFLLHGSYSSRVRTRFAVLHPNSQMVSLNRGSRLVAPEIGAALSPGVIAAPVASACAGVRIEIPPFAAVFAAVRVGIIAVYLAGAGRSIPRNDYRFDGIVIAAHNRRCGASIAG